MAFFRTESLISFFMPRGKNKNRKRNNKTVFPELPKQQVQQSIQIIDEKQNQIQKIDTKVEPKLEQKIEQKLESKPKRMTQQEMDALLEVEPEPKKKQEIIIKSLEPRQEKIDLNYKIEIPRFNDSGEIWIVPEDYKPQNIGDLGELEYEDGRIYTLTDEDRENLQNGGFIEFKGSVSIKCRIIEAWYEYTLFLGDIVDTDKLSDEQMKIISNYQIIDHYLYSFNDEYLKPRNTDDRKWCYLHGIEYPFSNILDRNEKNIAKINGFFIGYYGEIEDDNHMSLENKNRYHGILREIMDNSGQPFYNRFLQAKSMFINHTKPEIIRSLFHDLPYWEKNGVPAWKTPLWEIITRYNNCIKFYDYHNWNK